MGKPKDNRFKDKDTEDFYNGERVLKFQELSRSDKQEAHRKVVLIYKAKNWKEITMYFPYGASGGRLEKIGDKGQHSIRLSKNIVCYFGEIKSNSVLMISELTLTVKSMENKSYGKR